MSETTRTRTWVSLAEAPQGKPLRIVEIAGGEGVRRRLFSMGFNIGDQVERMASGIFRGPVLVKNLRSDIAVALGRGIAQKILVEETREHA